MIQSRREKRPSCLKSMRYRQSGLTSELRHAIVALVVTFQVLETDGGRVAVILGMLIFLLGSVLVLTMTGHPLKESGKEFVEGLVAPLFTLLLAYLAKK